jgi:acetyl esterase
MLDPQLRQLLAFSATQGLPDLGDLPAPAARAVYSQMIAATDLPDSPALAEVQARDLHVPGAGGHALPLRIYTPAGQAAAPRGLVLYLHGGGFVVGTLDDYDRLVRRLCLATDCVCVSVDYRLAPEHPFPAAVDDAQTALRWAFDEAPALGVDPTRIAVAGDSAGGNLAAGLAIRARDEGLPLRYQALAYPVTAQVGSPYPSYAAYGKGYVLSQRMVDSFVRQYFGPGEPAPDWRGAPLLAASLRGVAPALVMVAGHDVLHDEGVAYAQRLCEADVQATLVDYGGLAHGFLQMGGALHAARLATDHFGAALRIALQA